ncbi:ABC transporter substrate-binding protein [Domibacillus tundrae]|uniref:ABC transporter substrate-binding protein n=1 Tax=Domibacillus tundrae TaxID=1587527 RepID=UPI0033957789
MKKWVSLVATTSLFAGLMAGCGPSDSSTGGGSGKSNGDKEIVFWAPFSGPDGPNMQKIVDGFNEKQDEYDVKLQIVPQSEYYKTVDLALNGQDDAPELMIMHGDQIMTYAEQDVLKGLDDIVGDTVQKDQYHENAWKGAEVEGTTYGVPLDIHPLMFYWNKDLFKAAGLDPESPPTNREEFIAAAQKLTKADEGQWGFALPTLWPQQFIFPTIVYQNGGTLIEDKTADYTSEAVVDALQFEKDLISKYKVSPENVQQDGELTLFLQGKNAMHLNGPWMLNQFEESNINFGVSTVPRLGTKQDAVFANSHNFVIPASVEDETTVTGIEEFLSYVADNGMAWAESGQAPASKAVYESEEFGQLKQQPQVAKQFDYVQYSPAVANWGPVSDPLFKAVNEALLGQKDVKQALEDAEKESQAQLQ